MKTLVGSILFVLITVAVADAQVTLSCATFTRAGASPHALTLSAALSPSLFTYPPIIAARPGFVDVCAASYAGVNLVSVQAQVDAAPADTTIVSAKFEKARVIGLTPCLMRSIAEVLLDEVNTIRANIAAASLAPRTLTQMNTAIDAKIDALGCQ